MRAIRIHEHGGPDVLQVEDIDRPEAGPDELLVAVGAAGINPVDTYFRDGSYEPVALPFTPGVDLAGEVVETGADVDAFDAGDRVFGTGIGNGSAQGSYAEFACVPVDRVVALPDGVDVREAGAAGVVAGTAWRALVDHGELAPAETCLVHGGAGGVGHIAVQLASIAGAHVIATCADRDTDRVSELGADDVLPYDHDDLAGAISDRASDGVDVILDHKLDRYASLDAAVAGTRGRVVGIGEDDPRATIADTTGARSRDVSFTFMSMFNTPDLRVPLGRIAALLDRGDLRVTVDHTYHLDAAPTAHRELMSDHFLGKRILEP